MSANVTIALVTQGTAGATNEALSPGTFAVGVNLSGLEYNAGSLGIPNQTYAVPTLSELQSYQAQGIDLVRLPFAWERMQPTLGGPLNATYVSEIQGVVNEAASLGMKVILDAHNYGGYGADKLGDGTLTDAQFANMWQQVATVFASNAGIAGYDLMNEPNAMPNVQAWPQAAQAAISAIRTVDSASAIYVEGDDWSSAGSWTQNNARLASLVDPSNNLIFSAHLYLDTDNSGTHFDWAQQEAAGDTVDIGVQRLQNFVSWLQANNRKGDIGEIGVGNDNTAWLTALNNTLAYAKASNLQVTYWAGGPWWGNYPLSVETVNGVVAPQAAVLDRYSGDMETVTTATLAGTADANTTLYLSENDVTLATTTSDGSGAWSFSLTGLADGAHTIAVSEVPPGQDGIIAALSFILATPAPTPVVTPTAASVPVVSVSTGTSCPQTAQPVTIEVAQHSGAALTATSDQDVLRIAPGTGASSVTNFAAGNTLQLLGASSYTVSDYHLDDILWDNGAFAPYLWELNANSIIGGGPVGGTGGQMVFFGYHIASIGDFNGDGVSDILLSSNNGTGAAVMWFMNHGTISSSAVLPYGATPVNAWTGDFNGDGKSDILWDNGSSAPFLWEMSGSAIVASGALGFSHVAVVAPGYHIAGVGDFNGDGKSDILWAANGVNPGIPTMIWFMDSMSASAALLPYAAPSTKAWVGDFNGNGYSDILWDGNGGTSVIWEMQATNVVGVGIVQGLFGYHIAGVGDFNGDGKSDILWAANVPAADAPAIIYFMNGTTVSAAALSYGATPTTALIGDFNLDGAKVTGNGGSSVILDSVDRHNSPIDIQTSSATVDYSAQTVGVTANLITGASLVAGDNLLGYRNITGSQYDDTLRGNGENGVSTLIGNGGSDTYQFALGDGAVSIVNGVSGNNGATGAVDFLAGVTDQELWFAKSGNNLVIDLLGTRDQLTIQNWYSGPSSDVGEFVDAGSLKLDSALGNLVQAMATFSAAHPGFSPQTGTTIMPADATLQSTIAASWHA